MSKQQEEKLIEELDKLDNIYIDDPEDKLLKFISSHFIDKKELLKKIEELEARDDVSYDEALQDIKEFILKDKE